MIIFAYLPYGLAEGIKLSGELKNRSMIKCVVISVSKSIRIDVFLFVGIMAILFSGIVMSHYTHHNLSPVTQILMQQTLRTVAFMCGQFLARLSQTYRFIEELFCKHELYSCLLFLFHRNMRVCVPGPVYLQFPS